MSSLLFGRRDTLFLGFAAAGMLITTCDCRGDPGESDDEPGSPGEDGEDPMTLPEGKEPPPGEAAAALAAEVDRELAAMRRSSYTHQTHVDEAAGIFEYDCSGFVIYALSRAVPSALATLRQATVHRPLARHFTTFLGALPVAGTNRWRRVDRVQDLRRGDLIAWLRPPDTTSRNTGHIMIVHGPIAPDPRHPGATIVPIVDSTTLPHRPGDSRTASGVTGLGRGEVVLRADNQDAPIGFHWSRGPKSRERVTTIVLARLA